MKMRNTILLLECNDDTIKSRYGKNYIGLNPVSPV